MHVYLITLFGTKPHRIHRLSKAKDKSAYEKYENKLPVVY